MSSANGGFLVSEGFEAYVGPMLVHKNSKHKEKCWEFMFGHFDALVLSSNRKDSRWELILTRVQVYIGPFWGVKDRRVPNLNSDAKSFYVWVQIDVLRGSFGPLSRA